MKKKTNPGLDANKFIIDLATGSAAASISKTAVASIKRVKLLVQVFILKILLINTYCTKLIYYFCCYLNSSLASCI